MFLKGAFSTGFTWNHDLSIRDNVCHVINDYLPYRFNALTQKTHLIEARDLITYLETHPKTTDCEIYLYIQARRQELSDENGEYKKRLNFCVQKMEEQNILLKTLGSAGQAYKSVFGAP
ncbi:MULTISPECIES: hypothetical protein [Legionella]|uniref:Uncharacterized protein n=1 Tax=Legionella resiliens TaxID=2905958 RepID=A0ABS8WZK3_9GAMM|nr:MULTISPECIES: hypothetical protein [unclassified Legionella]MCE0722003.1 hypothetical protein [Legionella sp. 9fVS26]MCE3531157.1 hypothetical protein [Legionella sp. 8cVS16]QLZ70745.1 hypothetical protein FOLKNPGA_03563 [Legionella sp. PC1000]